MHPKQKTDLQEVMEAAVARAEKNTRLLAFYDGVMHVVREMLAARALNGDVTPWMDKLEIFHTREIQLREGA